MSQLVRHEMDLRVIDGMLEKFSDFFGNSLVRDRSRIDCFITFENALLDRLGKMRLYRADPLPERFGGKVAIKRNMLDFFERRTDLPDAKFGGLARPSVRPPRAVACLRRQNLPAAAATSSPSCKIAAALSCPTPSRGNKLSGRSSTSLPNDVSALKIVE